MKLSVLDVVFSFKKCHESNRAPKKVKVTFSLQFLYQSKPQEMLSSQQCLERNQNIFTSGSDKLDKSEICMFSVYDPHREKDGCRGIDNLANPATILKESTIYCFKLTSEILTLLNLWLIDFQ